MSITRKIAQLEEVSLREAAKILGVHYLTALDLVHKGMLRARRVGSRWRISLAEIQRFQLEGNYVPPEGREQYE